MKLNKNIQILDNKEIVSNTKGSEEYIHVVFHYPSKDWEGLVPVEYRRTGVSINVNNLDELYGYLNGVYEQMNPKNYDEWKRTQDEWWQREKSGAWITREFFDALCDGEWKCISCQLPINPNYQRRIQDLKEFGYTIVTDTKRRCPRCNKTTRHLALLPIPRGEAQGNGYETWSPELRKRILRVLREFDVYEYRASKHCLPDHKFSEIRWDENTLELSS